MPKPEYTESCSDCIHYTETSYMFGDCEMCQHEVACDAICTMYAERHIEPSEFYRDAETVPVVTERAEAVHDYRKCANRCGDCNILRCDECTNFVPERDAVHPNHYHKGGLECFDVIKAITGDKYEGFLAGNVIKYIFRYQDKNGVEDCKKAAVYIDKLIKELQNEQ